MASARGGDAADAVASPRAGARSILARAHVPRDTRLGPWLLVPFRELLVPSVCPSCDEARRSGEPLLCLGCVTGLVPLPHLGEVHTAVAYEATGLRLLRRLKFEGRRDGLETLAGLLAARIAPLRADVVVPLPPHRTRLRELGADPVHALARAAARLCGVRLAAGALVRTRATEPQKALPPDARRRNLADSFAARGHALAGARVVLIDDITTTGATLREGASALRADSGAAGVLLAAVAGTLPERSHPLPTPLPPAL
jgi:predicted amidophosphoribosyltransferase